MCVHSCAPQQHPGAEIVSSLDAICLAVEVVCDTVCVVIALKQASSWCLGSTALLQMPPPLSFLFAFSRSSFQNRIEGAHTSDTLKKTVGMTRSMDMAAEREKGEEARAAAQKARDLQVESKETPDSRYVSLYL